MKQSSTIIEIIIQDISYLSALISEPPTLEIDEIEVINYNDEPLKIMGTCRWLPLRIVGNQKLANLIKQNSNKINDKITIKIKNEKEWQLEYCWLGAKTNLKQNDIEIIFRHASLVN